MPLKMHTKAGKAQFKELRMGFITTNALVVTHGNGVESTNDKPV
jgi:hypothetical protein